MRLDPMACPPDEPQPERPERTSQNHKTAVRAHIRNQLRSEAREQMRKTATESIDLAAQLHNDELLIDLMNAVEDVHLAHDLPYPIA